MSAATLGGGKPAFKAAASMINQGAPWDFFMSHKPALHASVRSLLNKMKLPFKEFKYNRDKTQSCGSGGMLDLTNPKLAKEQMVSRAHQTECDTIVSYCQECARSMSRGGKSGVHILDLLFTPPIAQSFKQPLHGTLTSWMNRYKTKRMIQNFKVKL
jgi:Fe-S oxidoreductase